MQKIMLAVARGPFHVMKSSSGCTDEERLEHAPIAGCAMPAQTDHYLNGQASKRKRPSGILKRSVNSGRHI